MYNCAYIHLRCGLFGPFTSTFIQSLLLYNMFLHHQFCLFSTLQYSILHQNEYSVVEFRWIVIRNGIWNTKAGGTATARLWIQFVIAAQPNVLELHQTVTQIMNLTLTQLVVTINEVMSNARHV